MSQHSLEQLLDYFDIKLQQTFCELLTLSAFQTASPADIVFHNLQLNSRLVASGDAFIALKGQQQDGRDYIASAVASGAKIILADADKETDDRTINIAQKDGNTFITITIYQLANHLSALANFIYDNPSEHLQTIGITGTNGKTTISQLIAQWIALLGQKSAVIGTLGNGLYNQLVTSDNTTPSALDVQKLLADFVQQKVNVVAMEVSSHGLVLGRVKSVNFSAAVFTNLSRDHLDFHQTMENYEQAKWSLFSTDEHERAVNQVQKRIINYDDAIAKKWLAKLSDCVVVSANPIELMAIQQLNRSYVCATNIEYHDRGASIEFVSSWGSATIESALFGEFNVANLLMALATLLSLDYDFNALITVAKNLQPICGRMEIFSQADKPTVIIDYAHTPDALEKALTAARIHCNKKLWVIFGCGGDRDAGKRPLMAQIAEKHADCVIVTNDNPRTEDPALIINDILAGLQSPQTVQVITERAKALEAAVQQAQPGDIILVAGKGHEDYQILGKTKVHYSDRETAAELLGCTL